MSEWFQTPCIKRPGNKAGGYSLIKDDGRLKGLHSWAWEQAHGPIPEGMFVLHRCDNPPCYNVDHLFLGTPTDNMRDKLVKGRAGCLRGEAHPHARLTDEEVREIRMLYACGEGSTRVLARQYGSTQPTIAGIVRGSTRRYV